MVLEREATMLSSAGHVVEHFIRTTTQPGSAWEKVKLGADAVWNREAVAELAEQVRSFRPDVVHVHTPFPILSPAVLRVGARTGTPTVTTTHSYRYSCVRGTCLRDGAPCELCIGTRTRLPAVVHACYHDSRPATVPLAVGLVFHRAIGTLSRRVDRFIALTPFMRDLLVRDGIPADKVVVKPNFVADPGPPSDAREHACLYVGRLTVEKGITTMLEAWGRLEDPPRLLVVGTGPLEPQVLQAARDNPAITHLGWLDPAEVGRLMATVRFLVFPSEWYEAAPLVLLEALAAGTPVIAASHRNLADFADGEVGHGFRSGDAADLAATVTRAMAVDTPAMQRAARSRYEARYSPEVNLPLLEAIYESVLER